MLHYMSNSVWAQLSLEEAVCTIWDKLSKLNLLFLLSTPEMSLDSGMVVVIIISMMYMVIVFGLLFYVKNDWCDLLFKNFTVMFLLS